MKWLISFNFVILAFASFLACSDDGTPAAPDRGVDGAVKDRAVEGLTPDSKKTCTSYPDAGAPGSCAANTLEVFKGTYTVVLNTLKIADQNKGFDLNNDDCDGNPLTGEVDGFLNVIGSLANTSLEDSMKQGEVAIPFEFYDLEDTTTDTCTNFSIYVGRFPVDADKDGEKVGGALSKPGKDCNDTDSAISPKKTEVAANGVDDDCDGLADESGSTPSTDTTDADGDGQTLAQGDCDDRKTKGATIKKGGTEICGDGLDNDCNGKADDGCLPWSKGMAYPVESLGLDTAQKQSRITFRGAKVTSGKLLAGPSLFSVKVNIASSAEVDFNLTHVFIAADVKKGSDGLSLENGLLGGVLASRAMDQAPNFAEQIGVGTKDDSFLDALLSPLAATLLKLPTDKDGNAIPDIDVDGDGIEKFLDKNLDGDKTTFRVDTCVDGDGTTVQDTYDSTTKKVVTRCTEAKTSSGAYRFVDGWSVAFTFTGVPSTISGIVTTVTP